MAALKVHAWSCDADIVSSVSCRHLVGGFALVHVDLNTEGKRAEVDHVYSQGDDVVLVLTYHPLVDDVRIVETRDALLRVYANQHITTVATYHGRYTIFALISASPLGDLGDDLPRVEAPTP